VPLAIEFPFPAWATRLSECAAPPTSPTPASTSRNVFDRLPVADLDDDDGIDPPPPF
jgi:hypothetical protein